MKSMLTNRAARPVYMGLAVICVLSILIAGCNPFKQTNANPQSLTPQATSEPEPTVVIPAGMPVCYPGVAGAGEVIAAEPVVKASDVITPFAIYKGGRLAAGWSDASWGGVKPLFLNLENKRDGFPTIKVTYPAAWSGFGIADWNQSNTVDTSQYSHLHFWVHGGQNGGQAVGVLVYTDSGEGERVRVDMYIKGGKIPANQWQEVYIPLGDFKAEGQRSSRIGFQEASGNAQPPIYLDCIEFFRDDTPLPTPVTANVAITVDLSKNRQPISPLIYGMSQAPEDVVKDANITINRQGGNTMSTYNWTIGNARNSGSDWEFRNRSGENDPEYKQPSGLADMFFKAAKRNGAESLLTVPMIGWVSKNDDNDTRSTGVPAEGGASASAGSDAIPGYDPAQNRQKVFVQSQARKGAPFADPPSKTGPVFQDEWVNHLVQTFGKAADGGVRFYSMDNEPDLWADDTHVDVHPVRVGYYDMLRIFTEYAEAVKAVDPTAQVTGPVVSGWTGYWYSALDRGSDGFKTAADRKAHGNTPLLPWFLDAVKKRDAQTGKRSLDVLDIHYYPQGAGIYSQKADPKTAELRLRATRSLWDPSYKDESWIARSEQPNVQLIPLMKGWIDQNYPGTKLGITEWNFGADETVNGALAIADVLGIYGREGVYLANYWTNPKIGSPGMAAFKMYRDYDGKKSTFGDTSVLATAEPDDPNLLSVFASEDASTKQAKIIVVNKSPKSETKGSLTLKSGSFKSAAKVYQLGNATQGKIQAMPDATVNGGSVSYTFPPYSVTLLVVDKAP